MRRLLLLVFLTTIALDWPALPFNMRATDILFIPAALAILTAANNWTRPRLHFLDAAIVIYLAGSFASLVLSPEPRDGAVEFVRHLYVAVIYAVIAIAVRQGYAPTVATGLALSGGLLAITGLIAGAVRMITGYGTTALTPLTSLPYIGDTVRIRALTASESMFACLLAVAMPFALLHPAIQASRRRTMVAAVVLGAAGALTFSHSIAGIAVAGLIVSWRHVRFAPIRAAAVTVAVLVVLAFNFAATIAIRSVGTSPLRDDTVFQYGVDRGRTEIAGVNIEYQTMSYLRIKQVALDAFVSRPVFGIGLDRFHDMTEAAFQQGRLTANYRAIDPHSTFIGRLAETGLLGLVTLIVLWIAIGRAVVEWWAIASPPEWMALAATAALAGTLVNTMNADVMNFRFLWVVLGLMRGRLAVHS
jgi:O-antigen ligase